jgi:hypothetical protein
LGADPDSSGVLGHRRTGVVVIPGYKTRARVGHDGRFGGFRQLREYVDQVL